MAKIGKPFEKHFKKKQKNLPVNKTNKKSKTTNSTTFMISVFVYEKKVNSIIFDLFDKSSNWWEDKLLIKSFNRANQNKQ